MPAANGALETQGAKFYIANAGSPTTYLQVKGVQSFSGFGGSAQEIDVTDLDSSAKEFLMGLQDFGNFELSGNYLPADPGQVAMRAAKASRALQEFKFELSNGQFFVFSGYVLSNPISGGVDAKTDGTFTVRISGDVDGPRS